MTDPETIDSLTLVLMGVSGTGKSRVMPALAERLGAVSAEGDTFHSAANVAKMAAGIPLDDDDRWPWLRSIAKWIDERERENSDAVITCSALRRRYRDLLRDGHPSVRFIHLTVPTTVLERRLAARTGHYMPPSLLPSQLHALEPLGADEPGFEVVADRPPADLADEIIARLAGGSARHT
jgi:gluconokinase